MIPLVVALAVLMGVVLGLLGGGGSILTVPLLVYVAGIGAKEAIATSLLVVGVTSAVAVLQHARAGNVKWRCGLTFGVFAMAGAYGGGHLAALFSGEVLLVLFALLMLVTGIAMLRGKKPTAPEVTPNSPIMWKIALDGLVVGAVTGLVGAGGGFLVVPALIFFAGLPVRHAVGTSLLIIAMKSFAGLAGHLSHLSIDLPLATMITGAAVVGSLGGVALMKHVPAKSLRQGFAVFVLLIALVMLATQAPQWMVEAVFIERWPFWVGGLAIGGFVVMFYLATRQALGVSTGFVDACASPLDPDARKSWRIPFIGGIVLGGILAAFLGSGFELTTAMGMFDAAMHVSFPIKATLFTAGGILLGFGARLAGGCTSGHGIVGVALLAPSSLMATGAFMVAGFVVASLLFGSVGGA